MPTYTVTIWATPASTFGHVKLLNLLYHLSSTQIDFDKWLRHLMAKFGPDTMPKKYMEAHAAVCKHYGFETTNTIHIAVAPQTPEWREYHRDETFNRVNIAKAIKRCRSSGTFFE